MTSNEGAKASNIPAIRQRKSSGPPVVMVTAYDAPSARAAFAAGVDMVLVGDSLGMVVLGYPDTMHVSLDDMVRATEAVVRAGPSCPVVADMPWTSYHAGPERAVDSAARLVRAGASAVKLEGGAKRLGVVQSLLDAEVPVMGHLGLTPQSVLAMGGYKTQGRSPGAAKMLVEDAIALADAGCFAIVLEGVPTGVAETITAAVPVPTIGIGAGAGCDGQVLVFHDIIGWAGPRAPRFVRRYADLERAAVQAIVAFASDVREGRFPTEDESYSS
ncbi:MAG TPA: 3-methyl-2-oxobutanoate hydroxymethyltransferase [Acidimicrobiales bacterium]|nr:3-methyl-2-oxobutanoate hydroxymethyltransferase [Acidimicrobiales bacterium]